MGEWGGAALLSKLGAVLQHIHALPQAPNKEGWGAALLGDELSSCVNAC
jgi:hypothetical protein